MGVEKGQVYRSMVTGVLREVARIEGSRAYVCEYPIRRFCAWVELEFLQNRAKYELVPEPEKAVEQTKG